MTRSASSGFSTPPPAGDDGEVGRGNRANGLITPYRPMSIEAVAGKNPVYHLGKLYNLAAGRIATVLIERLDAARDATCILIGEIGRPVHDPALADVELGLGPNFRGNDVEPAVRVILAEELSKLGDLREALLAGRVRIY